MKAQCAIGTQPGELCPPGWMHWTTSAPSVHPTLHPTHCAPFASEMEHAAPRHALPADLKLALAQELAVAHVRTTALEEAYSQPPSAWLVSSVTSGSDG